MKKKKVDLKRLKVQSFITTIKGSQADRIKGGTCLEPTLVGPACVA